jgi:hypothetical protein
MPGSREKDWTGISRDVSGPGQTTGKAGLSITPTGNDPRRRQ